MKTILEHIRDRLEQCLHTTSRKPDLEELRRTQWSPEFEQLMRNRLVMGAMRYGTFEEKADTNNPPYDYVGSVGRRLAEYQRTGNTEFLVDAANCLLLEFEFGVHPTKHFHAVDDGPHVTRKDIHDAIQK